MVWKLMFITILCYAIISGVLLYFNKTVWSKKVEGEELPTDLRKLLEVTFPIAIVVVFLFLLGAALGWTDNHDSEKLAELRRNTKKDYPNLVVKKWNGDKQAYGVEGTAKVEDAGCTYTVKVVKTSHRGLVLVTGSEVPDDVDNGGIYITPDRARTGSEACPSYLFD